jgi:HlyD family secretion protein
MKKKRVLLIGAAVVVVAGLAAVGVVRSRSAQPLAVQTARAARQRIVQKVSGTGKIRPKTQVEISADVSAKIIQLPVVEGQRVEKGALLVSLDRERYVAAVESGEATVRSAEANATLVRQNMSRARNEYGRSKELLARGLESQAAFEAKQAEYEVEAARYASTMDQVEQAKAALKQARTDLAKTTIYSPMAGTVSALNKEQGEIALGSQFQKDIILVVADLNVMEAEVNVDESDVTSIAIGQKAEIEVDAMLDQRLTGVVSEIASSANTAGLGTTEQKTEFTVKITILDPPKTLRPGMTASADIITRTNEHALSVPLQSVAIRSVDQLTKKGQKRADAEKAYRADRDGFVEIVFVLDKGRAIARQVKTGIQSDELIEILSGIAEGAEVVSGSYRAISKDLVNGAVVTINQTPAKPDAEKGVGP